MVFVDVREMAAEVEHLRAELQAVTEALAVERAHRNILQRAVLRLRAIEEGDEQSTDSNLDSNSGSDSGGGRGGANSNSSADVLSLREKRRRDDKVDEGAPDGQDDSLYVFDDEDASRAAFDEFFATPDPHLDKVRGFLLD